MSNISKATENDLKNGDDIKTLARLLWAILATATAPRVDGLGKVECEGIGVGWFCFFGCSR